MTSPTDQFTDVAGRGQDAVTTAVRAWADTVQSLTHRLTTAESPLSTLPSLVDQYFDLTEQVLAGQRELARQWASGVATTSATDAAEAVVDRAADTVHLAGENAAATVRAADGTVNDN